jgi:hypothetical protein
VHEARPALPSRLQNASRPQHSSSTRLTLSLTSPSLLDHQSTEVLHRYIIWRKASSCRSEGSIRGSLTPSLSVHLCHLSLFHTLSLDDFFLTHMFSCSGRFLQCPSMPEAAIIDALGNVVDRELACMHAPVESLA